MIDLGRRRGTPAVRNSGRKGTTRARLKAGELGLDIYGLRDVLARLGVEWRD